MWVLRKEINDPLLNVLSFMSLFIPKKSHQIGLVLTERLEMKP